MTDTGHGLNVEGPPTKRVKLSPTNVDSHVPGTYNGQSQRSVDGAQTSPSFDEVNRKEGEVGITVYVSDGRPFLRGLLKKRYTDFLVNEITPEGQVLHLTKLKGLKPDHPDAEVDKHPHTTTETPASGSTEGAKNGSTRNVDTLEEPLSQHELSHEDCAELSKHFSEATVSQIQALYNSVISNPKAKPSDHTVVRTPFTTDRTLRAQIHQHIRRIFASRIESQTDHSGTLILSAAQPSRPNNNSSRNKHGKLSWAERGGEHLHFNLYKENKDSMEIVNLLARLMKMNPKDFGIAGTKDRRAATVQRVSVYRMDDQRLVGLNKTLRAAAVGDFGYKEKGQELGDLSGNEFKIALRECEVADEIGIERLKEIMTKGMKDLRDKGFLNYYGLQRFGTFGIRTDEIGSKILKGEYESACNMLLEFNPQVLEDFDNETNSAVGRDDKLRAEAIDVWRKGSRVGAALDKMPKRFSAETNLIRHLGKSQSDYLGALLTIPRSQRTMYVHAYQSRVWNIVASERWKLSGYQVVEGDLVLVNEHKDKEATKPAADIVDADGEVVIQASAADSSKTGDDIFERARHLTAKEVASGQYSIFDIVLPTPGWDIEYPKNASGDFYKTFMATVEGGELDPHDMRRKQRDFSLSGSYRKVMARIGKVFEVDIRRYTGEDETLLQTDLDIIRGHVRDDQAANEDENKSAEGEKPGGKLAVVLKFQLGSSQYATMALRELSKGGIREYKPDFSGGR